MFGEEEVPHFTAPIIQDNSTGWGPCDMPDQFKDMPYQPFSKGDRLGKVNHVWLPQMTYVFTLCMLFVFMIVRKCV